MPGGAGCWWVGGGGWRGVSGRLGHSPAASLVEGNDSQATGVRAATDRQRERS